MRAVRLAPLALALGCAPTPGARPVVTVAVDAPARAPFEATPPAPPPAAPTVPRPPAACEIEPLVRLLPRADGGVDAVALLSNTTDAPLRIALAAPCPAGPATFTGLPEGYDAADLCARGACPPGAPAVMTLELAPFGTAELARTTLGPSSACHPALPPGRYEVGVSVVLHDATACAPRTARHTVADTAPRRRAPARPAPRPPREDPCPAMACAYEPCPPGVEPPTGCAAVCGCPGGLRGPLEPTSP